jgi:hypothetical protein
MGLSKGAAFYRKTAVMLIQRVPAVVEPLRDGRPCLTTIVELSKVLTPENRDEVLPRFFELSKSEAEGGPGGAAAGRGGASPGRRDRGQRARHRRARARSRGCT